MAWRGWRWCRAAARARSCDDVVTDVLRDELIGADPLQREWLWHRMWEIDRTEELPIYILGLVDIALWDLAGRAVGRPVWQLLGGFREAIPAYASTATFATTQEYLDVASQCLDARLSGDQAARLGRRARGRGAVPRACASTSATMWR